MKRGILLLLIISIIIIEFASASFNLHNYSIEKIYSPEENLRGWINISLSNEQADSKIEASESFLGSIELIDFLNANEADYNCNPEDCESYYSAINPATTKNFYLSSGKEAIYGFVLRGNNVRINGLSFNITAGSSLSCVNPLEIDILNDNNIEWKSKSVSNDFSCIYKGGTGCFNSNEETNEVSIGITPFCEKISLPQSEKFQLGAWIKKRNTAWYSGLLIMELYNLDGALETSCKLNQPISAGGEISCVTEFSNEKTREYYVCVGADKQTDYTIKTESIDSCGFYAYPGEQTEYHDYYIFAKGARFANIGKFSFNQAEYEKQENEGDLAEYADSYLERYNRNCTDKCVIPVKFKANANLNIIISSLDLNYETGAGPSATPETKIYDTEKLAGKISSGSQILDLSEAGIITPSEYEEYNLQLYLGGEEILPDEIEIEVIKVPLIKNLVPKIVPVAIPVKFTAYVSPVAGSNISVYKWNFGDGENETTYVNYTLHAYPEIKDYNLRIEVEDSKGLKASKEFTIKAESPEKSINSTITRYKNRANNLSLELASMDEWYKNLIKEKINLESLNNELESLEKAYNSASTSDEYVDIMASLTDLRVPYAVKKNVQGDVPFFVSPEDVNLDYLEQLGAGNFNSENEIGTLEAIAGWAGGLDMSLGFEYVSAYYDEEIETLASVYDLKINSREKINNLYVLIGSNSVLFSQDYNPQEFSDATGIILSDFTSRNVEFAVSDIELENLVLYLSPKFSELEIIEEIGVCDFDGACDKDEGENWKNCRVDCKPWGVASMLLVVVFFIAIISYLLLQFWYERKYENHLFKNKPDLFNVMNFIKNAGVSGLSESEIKNKLKQSGWTGEQINYAFKKSKGKAIMPFDFLRLFNRQEKQKLEQGLGRGSIPRIFPGI